LDEGKGRRMKWEEGKRRGEKGRGEGDRRAKCLKEFTSPRF
jgi:hypothetical protein